MKNINFFKNKSMLLFLVYIAVLVLFAVFSYKVIAHDTWEYISLAKKFAGYLNGDVFSVHSLIYPFFISFFVKIFPSMITIKLVNLTWLVLTSILLYNSGLKKTAFIIWIFSPITWLMSIIISPFLPASFFFLVAYLSIKKWQDHKKNSYFIISALALGLSAAFCDVAIILAVFFVISFFYNKKFKEVIFYSLFTVLSFSVRLILDASLFSLAVKDKLIPFPIYSLVRFFSARLIIQLGLHPEISTSKLAFSSLGFWSFLILISPLLFYLFKINYQKNKNIIIFLTLSTILFMFQGGSYMYFLILAPITVVLLSKTFKRKELFLHILISCFITFILVIPYFVSDKQEVEERDLVINDLKSLTKEYDLDQVVFSTKTLAMFYLWDKNLPYFISPEEHSKILQNDHYYTYYAFEVKPKIDTQKILELKAGLKVNVNKDIDYPNLPIILEKGKTQPERYKLTKCYDLLCLYQKN